MYKYRLHIDECVNFTCLPLWNACRAPNTSALLLPCTSINGKAETSPEDNEGICSGCVESSSSSSSSEDDECWW